MAILDHLNKLDEGVSAWNEWRVSNPDRNPDLSGADLRDYELAGVNFIGVNLDRTDLRDADLNGANLSLAILDHANFGGAVLTLASLQSARGSHTKFVECDATGADFSEAEIRNGYFNSSILNRTIFANSVLKDSQFNEASIVEADLRRTDFRDSNLIQVDLTGAKANQANLTRCNLGNANLQDSDFSGAKLKSVDLSNADLKRAKLTNADIRGVKSLTCDRLIQAIDWETTIRDEALSCGASIPEIVPKSATEKNQAKSLGATPSPESFYGDHWAGWRGDISDTEREALRLESRQSLIRLRNELDKFQQDPLHGEIGHNKPPDVILPDEITDQIRAEVGVGIELHDAPRPDKNRLGSLKQALQRFLNWIKPRFETIGDAAAETIGKGIGAAVLIALWEAIQALANFIGSFL